MGCQCAKKDPANDQEITKESPTTSKEVPSMNPPAEIKATNEEALNAIHNVAPTNGKNESSFTNQSISKISESESRSRKKVDYNKEVFTLINAIRSNPAAFAKDIEDAISKITSIEGKLVYKGAVKVALKKGESAFKEAVEILRSTEPLEPFSLCEDIAIVVPEEEEKIKSTKVFQELVEEKKKNVIIDAFFKDLVKDPYTSVLLMIVDDNGKSAGKKRNVLLGKDYKKIAVTSRKVKKTFCAYFTFQN